MAGLTAVGCTSGGDAPGASARHRHDAAGPSTTAPRALHGQFSVAAAERLAPPDRPDARALRELARGALPTPSEVDAAMADMADISAHPDVSPGDPEEARRLAAQVAAAKSAAVRFATPAAARAAGYRLASGFLPGVGAHWIDWSRVVMPFDPARPAMLLFDAGSDPKLVGLSYYVRGDGQPDGFRAAGAVWHRHAGLCIVNGVLVAESVGRREDCAGGRGALLPGRDLWMLHAWVVPGHENPLGTFAPLNSSLCSADAPCTPDGSIPTGAPAARATDDTTVTHAHLDYAHPKPHPSVAGHRAWNVNPIVVEVSELRRHARPTTGARARADALVRRTVATLRRYRHLDAAIADGYVPLPDDPIHWYRPDLLADGRVLDPDRPEFLVYVDPDRAADDLRSDEPPAALARRVVVGAMYWAADPPAHGPQPGGPLTVWHFHEWSPDHWCGDAHGLPLATPLPGGGCPAGAPIGRSAEMLHVWSVRTPDGPFATSMEFLRAPRRVLRTNRVR